MALFYEGDINYNLVQLPLKSPVHEDCRGGAINQCFNKLGEYETLEEQGKLLNKWISSEEPPAGGNYILLSFENFSIPLVGRYEEDGKGGAFYVGDDGESCISQGIIVNGWMPLPEPYRD